MKKSYKNNKCKISVSKWNKKFDLPDGLHTVSDIQDYFDHIIKEHETVTDDSPIRLYVNKIENRIIFRIKIGYYLELLTSETMKLFGSTKCKINKN